MDTEIRRVEFCAPLYVLPDNNVFKYLYLLIYTCQIIRFKFV